jgi:hypothetical protein
MRIPVNLTLSILKIQRGQFEATKQSGVLGIQE